MKQTRPKKKHEINLLKQTFYLLPFKYESNTSRTFLPLKLLSSSIPSSNPASLPKATKRCQHMAKLKRICLEQTTIPRRLTSAVLADWMVEAGPDGQGRAVVVELRLVASLTSVWCLVEENEGDQFCVFFRSRYC